MRERERERESLSFPTIPSPVAEAHNIDGGYANNNKKEWWVAVG